MINSKKINQFSLISLILFAAVLGYHYYKQNKVITLNTSLEKCEIIDKDGKIVPKGTIIQFRAKDMPVNSFTGNCIDKGYTQG